MRNSYTNMYTVEYKTPTTMTKTNTTQKEENHQL